MNSLLPKPQNPGIPELATTAEVPMLTSAQHRQLSEVPSAIEWFANIDNPQTRRAYENDLRGFMQFVGIQQPEDFRTVTRSHVLAWRKTLEVRQLGGATIRRKLAALASLFEHLCESNAVTHNPVKGVKRPVVESQQGKTPALGVAQARALLSTPDANTLKEQARPRYSLGLALSWLTPGRTYQAEGEGLLPTTAGSGPFAGTRQRRQ